MDASNEMLANAQKRGVTFEFVSREQYRAKYDPDFLGQLRNKYGDYFLIPEGGTNQFAILGTSGIVDELPQQMTHVITALGTGGTATGMAMHPNQLQVEGIPAYTIKTAKNVIMYVNPLKNAIKENKGKLNNQR